MRAFFSFLLIALLCCSCSEEGNPFPYLPCLPDDFNSTDTYYAFGGKEVLTGNVAMITCQTYQSDEGWVAQCIACFDTAGHCLEYYSKDTEKSMKYSFTYDSTGHRATATFEGDSTQTTTSYRHSNNGRIYTARLTDLDGKQYHFRLRYNRQHRLKHFIYPDGSRISYEYDTIGRLSKLIYPDASEKHFTYLPESNHKTFDSQGRCLEEVVEGNGEQLPIVVLYEYDTHNNWIRRTISKLDDSSISRIDIREIQYY